MSTTLWQPEDFNTVQPSKAITGQQISPTQYALHVLNVGGSTPSMVSPLTPIYQEISGVPQGVLTDIFTYTVPGGQNALLRSVQVTGDNLSTYYLVIAGSTIMAKRSYYSDFNITFNLNYGDSGAIIVSSGQTIVVRSLGLQNPSGLVYAGRHETTAIVGVQTI